MQQHNNQFPSGIHPFLKMRGKPAKILISSTGYSPEMDPSNFSLEGRLVEILHSSSFAGFVNPYFYGEGEPGRTTVEIWQWLTWKLRLRRWDDQTQADLDWLDERLRELDFLTRRVTDGVVRWFIEGC